MKAHEIRALTLQEIEKKVSEWQSAHFHGWCQKSIGQQQNTSELARLRRWVARGKTIIAEKRKQGEG